MVSIDSQRHVCMLHHEPYSKVDDAFIIAKYAMIGLCEPYVAFLKILIKWFYIYSGLINYRL
jgi:hypothetical protein